MNHSVRSQRREEEEARNERLYSVKEVAKLSGVSIRTLHVYDEMDLLKPLTRTESRYRLYGEKELLRLQQILFYKELEFSLHDIREILDSPDFDLVQALKFHKKALLARRERLHTLLATIDKTISYLTKGEQSMNYQITTEELYEGLPKEFANEYREEAHQRWREETKRSEEAMRRMSKEDFGKLKDEFKENWRVLSTMTNQDPTSNAVQERILRHYALTRKFWGTSASSDTQAAQFKGLGQMYTEDPRFTVIDGTPHPEFAVFLYKAMTHFVEFTFAE
jgi:DNA-binding transcriptional MerR regulator